MFSWIKEKISKMTCKFGPIKIRSYTDVIKERSFPDIAKFRANVLNMNIDDIADGIKLIDHMGIDGTANLLHQEAYFDLQEIKTRFNQMKFSEAFGGFYQQNQYGQYNPYAQSQQSGFGYGYNPFGWRQ